MVKTKRERERDKKTPRTKRLSITKRPLSRLISHPSTSTHSIPTTNSVANIKVVVRTRPPKNRERGDNCRNVIQVVDQKILIFDPKEEVQGFFYQGVQQKHRDPTKKTNKHLQFDFDRVFDETVTNDDIFKETTQTLIDSLMDGYNCSVFAYGATGAGKTYTMIGSVESPGITFLTIAELFRRKDELCGERDFDLGISYLEVYNEQVQDLLNPGPALYLREDSKYGVIVAGIKVHKIEKVNELFKLLEEGNKNRSQHPTDANAESSRSHAVFQVYLQMKIKATAEVRTAKLSMIDLAGSERGSATGCVGARFKEGANINKSLLALGNCINSLADGHRHIPYRDSKLTRLLKDSLGGNCRTIMIANVSPSSLSYEDTYNTLKYATRANKIKSVVKKNVLDIDLHVGKYVEMVAQLKQELSVANTKLSEAVARNAVLEQQLEQSKKEKSKSEVEKCPKLEKTFVMEKDDVQLGIGEDKIEDKMRLLFKKKALILETSNKLELNELCINLRRQLKEEADSRISDICAGTPTRKDEAHKRMTNIVNRCHSKENVLKEKLDVTRGEDLKCDQQLGELLKKNPQLQASYDLEMEKLSKIALKYKLEQSQRAKEILIDDNTAKNNLLGKMANAIKSYHNKLSVCGNVPNEIQVIYEDVLKDYEGRKRIRWMDDGRSVVDSGLSSSSSMDTVSDVNDKENIQIVPESGNDGQLDHTFTIPEESSPKKVAKGCASIVTKAFKPTTPRSDNRVYAISPRLIEMQSKRRLLGFNTTAAGRLQPRSAAITSKKPPFRT